MKYQHKLEKERMCPIEHGLDAFGGKWKARIICVLSTDDTMRYKQLKKELNNMTDTVLASMLKDLIADGLIARTQYNEIPPRVEYALTDKGRSVLPILQSICAWAKAHTTRDLEAELPSCKSCSQLS